MYALVSGVRQATGSEGQRMPAPASLLPVRHGRAKPPQAGPASILTRSPPAGAR
jgi:hypothetical protein